MVLFAYRTSPLATTGESPLYLLYGREPRLHIDVSLIPREELSQDISTHRAQLLERLEDLQKLVKQRTVKAQQRMKELYDRRAKEVNFEIGQKV